MICRYLVTKLFCTRHSSASPLPAKSPRNLGSFADLASCWVGQSGPLGTRYLRCERDIIPLVWAVLTHFNFARKILACAMRLNTGHTWSVSHGAWENFTLFCEMVVWTRRSIPENRTPHRTHHRRTFFLVRATLHQRT